MAKPREIKRKILTITGTRKLTHTMELVATSRSKQNQVRMQAAKLYADGMAALVRELAGGGDIAHPLIGVPGVVQRAAVVVITSNRGLCGGFNAQVLRAAETVLRSLEGERAAAHVYMIGKRGGARFRHAGRTVEWSSTAFDDRPKVADVNALADRLIDAFLADAIQKAIVVSARFRSAGHQPVEVTPLLPIAPPARGAPHGGFLFHDRMDAMLDELLPRAVRTQLLRLLLESSTCEQIARRVAMKAATDNADDMLKVYRRMFNRARQSSITLELMDVIGGASAIPSRRAAAAARRRRTIRDIRKGERSWITGGSYRSSAPPWMRSFPSTSCRRSTMRSSSKALPATGRCGSCARCSSTWAATACARSRSPRPPASRAA